MSEWTWAEHSKKKKNIIKSKMEKKNPKGINMNDIEWVVQLCYREYEIWFSNTVEQRKRKWGRKRPSRYSCGRYGGLLELHGSRGSRWRWWFVVGDELVIGGPCGGQRWLCSTEIEISSFMFLFSKKFAISKVICFCFEEIA